MTHAEHVHPDDRLPDEPPSDPSAERPPLPETQNTIDEDDRLLAALCYASQIVAPLVVPAIVLLVEKYRHRPFLRYHAVQSLSLTLALAAALVALALGTVVVQVVPLIGALIGLAVFCLMPVIGLAALLMYLFYALDAFKGRWSTIPLLTDFLRDQGLVTGQR